MSALELDEENMIEVVVITCMIYFSSKKIQIMMYNAKYYNILTFRY